MAGVNEDLFDAATAYRLDLLRFEGGLVRDVLRAYDASIEKALALLRDLDRRVRRGEDVSPIELAQIGPLQRRLADDIRAAREKISALLTDGRVEAATETWAASAQSIATALPATLAGPASRLVMPVATLDAILAAAEPLGGVSLADRLAIDLLRVHDELRAVLTRAALQGLSVPDLARDIKAATGLAETYRGRMVTIARTEIQRVSNDAALASYRQHVDVLAGVQYLATLDSRTCPVCAPDHNRVFRYRPDGSLDPAAPTLPRHPRCRCFYAPVTKSWRDLGFDVPDNAQRRRLDGRRADSTTFDAWLRRRPRSTQEAILGQARAQMFRDGAALADFTDGRRLLSLGELRVPGL